MYSTGHPAHEDHGRLETGDKKRTSTFLLVRLVLEYGGTREPFALSRGITFADPALVDPIYGLNFLLDHTSYARAMQRGQLRGQG